MAKRSDILKITVTYDAGKLGSKMPEIVRKHMGRYARSSATGAKEIIDSGKLRKLEDVTIETRKRKNITGTKPLYETGTLHRSIKGKTTSKGGEISMMRYGIHHHRGFITGSRKVAPRPFISPSKKVILKAFDAFRKNIRKSFKKRGR